MLDIKEEALLEKALGAISASIFPDADPHPLRKFSIAPISLESFFSRLAKSIPKISAKGSLRQEDFSPTKYAAPKSRIGCLFRYSGRFERKNICA
ncbi:unknown [Coraliomargarita sp. CAG:312]|nr:unknown [Coraliomargarita sp. CAG:312]